MGYNYDMKAKRGQKVLIVFGVMVVLLIISVIVIFLLLICDGQEFESVRDDQNVICTTYGGHREKQCSDDYIGLTEQTAMALAQERDLIPQSYEVETSNGAFLDIGGATIYFKVERGIVVGVCFESYQPADNLCTFDAWR